MIILIDNGHGIDTAGKCSPDKRLREYKWAREIACLLRNYMKNCGYDARLIVPEEIDIPLMERCRRINAICDKEGNENVLFVSIHSNAAGADELCPQRSGDNTGAVGTGLAHTDNRSAIHSNHGNTHRPGNRPQALHILA